MTAITDTANSVYRDMESPGSTVPNEPEKVGIRGLFVVIDTALSSLGVNGAITVKKATKALLDADLAHVADTLAVVYNDATDANNGIYVKAGGSGAGSWSITALALPSSFATDIADVLSQLESIDADLAAAVADAVADGTAAAEAAQAAAEAAATDAEGSETAAASSAGSASASATAANVSYNAVLAAIAAGPLSGPYATKAAADAAALAGTLAANAYAYVVQDETQGSAPTVRQRVGSATTTTFVAALGGLAANFTTTVPVAASLAFTKTVMTMPAPTSGMTNGAGGNDAVNSRWLVTAGDPANGPVGQVNYSDTVAGFGVNLDTGFVPANSSMPGGGFFAESKFYQNGVFGSEFQIRQMQGASGGFVQFRVLDAFVPHDPADWNEKSQSSLRAGQYTFSDGDATPRLQLNVRTSDGGGEIALTGVGTSNLKLRFNKNNDPVFQQYNAAADAFLSLPYYDDRNVMRTPAASFQQGAAPTVGVNTSDGYFRENQNTTPRVGGGHEYILTGGSVAGNYYGHNFNGFSVSGKFYVSNAYNTHATGKLLDLRWAAGDIFWSASNPGGGNDVNFGRRASDGAFVIALGAPESFTNPAIEIANATRYLNLPAGRLNISGTKVLGTQGAALPADATDLASVIALANATKNRIQAGTGHGLTA
jgi:hypothetical protein